MHSLKQNSFINDQSEIDKSEVTRLNSTSVHINGDSSVRTYALIESNAFELDQVVDLLRQFFPNTKVIECTNQTHLSNVKIPQKQLSIESTCNSPFSMFSRSSFDSDINSDQGSSTNTNSQIFKGKVKDYLQRRYLEQIREHGTRKETFKKSRRDNAISFDLSLPHSTVCKPSMPLKSHSFDSPSNPAQVKSPSILHSQSKRRLLQHYPTIDMDDSPCDEGIIQLNKNQHDQQSHSSPFQKLDSEQQVNDQNNDWCSSASHSNVLTQQQETAAFSRKASLPITPYSAASDPGPFISPWYNTPTSYTRFRFPQFQEQICANAEGSIAQLSTLTQVLCDEPSVFTPVSPRLKTEKHDPITSKDSSSVPSCQICRQEFDSRQTYLTHYRTHLENSCQKDLSDIGNFDNNYDRSNNLRNYSCKICSKHFSRSDMLNRHLRLHSGTRPYKCVVCNAYFSRSDHLSTHFRTHTGEKPYTCPQCSYTACRRDMITRHIKIHMKQRSERKHAVSTKDS